MNDEKLSEARDAALEEVAKFADFQSELHIRQVNESSGRQSDIEFGKACGAEELSKAIRALKYIAGPVAGKSEKASGLPSPTIIPLPKPEMSLSHFEGGDAYPVFNRNHMHDFARQYGAECVRRAAVGAATPAPVQQAGSLPEHWRTKAAHIVSGKMDVAESAAQAIMLLRVLLAAPVQQAAPSVILKWQYRLSPGALRHWEKKNDETPAEMAMQEEISDLRAAFAAAPAQPVGLSEQDKLDACGTIHCREFHELAMDYRGAPAFTHAPAAYDRLVAYIDAAKVGEQDKLDAARLDFIDASSLHVQACYAESSNKPVYEICIVHGDIEDDSLQCIGSGSTLRDAIDAAILADKAAP